MIFPPAVCNSDKIQHMAHSETAEEYQKFFVADRLCLLDIYVWC